MRTFDKQTLEQWVALIEKHLQTHDGVSELTEGTRNVIRYALTNYGESQADEVERQQLNKIESGN